MTLTVKPVCGVLLLLGGGLLQACNTHDGRALEVIRRTDAALRGVRTVRYHVVYEPLGTEAGQAPVVEGDVTMSGWAGQGPARFRCEGRYTLPMAEDPVSVTLGRDEKTYYAIDPQRKVVYVGEAPAVFGGFLPVARSLLMLEFVHPNPFSEELAAARQSLRGAKPCDGRECDEVDVVYRNHHRATWLFSKQDFLPRAVHRLDSDTAQEARQTLTGVAVDTPADPNALRLQILEGYAVRHEEAP